MHSQPIVLANSFAGLPDEMLEQICAQCDLSSLLAARLVCKSWYGASENAKEFWQSRCLQLQCPDSKTWRQFYTFMTGCGFQGEYAKRAAHPLPDVDQSPRSICSIYAPHTSSSYALIAAYSVTEGTGVLHSRTVEYKLLFDKDVIPCNENYCDFQSSIVIREQLNFFLYPPQDLSTPHKILFPFSTFRSQPTCFAYHGDTLFVGSDKGMIYSYSNAEWSEVGCLRMEDATYIHQLFIDEHQVIACFGSLCDTWFYIQPRDMSPGSSIYVERPSFRSRLFANEKAFYISKLAEDGSFTNIGRVDRKTFEVTELGVAGHLQGVQNSVLVVSSGNQVILFSDISKKCLHTITFDSKVTAATLRGATLFVAAGETLWTCDF